MASYLLLKMQISSQSWNYRPAGKTISNSMHLRAVKPSEFNAY